MFWQQLQLLVKRRHQLTAEEAFLLLYFLIFNQYLLHSEFVFLSPNSRNEVLSYVMELLVPLDIQLTDANSIIKRLSIPEDEVVSRQQVHSCHSGRLQKEEVVFHISENHPYVVILASRQYSHKLRSR